MAVKFQLQEISQQLGLWSRIYYRKNYRKWKKTFCVQFAWNANEIWHSYVDTLCVIYVEIH